MKSVGILATVLMGVLLAGCAPPKIPPVKYEEYVWPDFKLYDKDGVIEADKRFQEYRKCLKTGQAAPERGEYETRDEYKKRIAEHGGKDCDRMLNLRHAQLRGSVNLRYNADHERFKFTPVRGIIHAGVLNAKTVRERIWGSKHLVIYLDSFARKPRFRAYIDGRDNKYERYERDGAPCKTNSRFRPDDDYFSKAHNDLNCYIPYESTRQAGAYVFVPTVKSATPEVRTRLYVDSEIDRARDLKDREKHLEVRVLGSVRLFPPGKNPYYKVNMDSVVGEFVASKIGIYDKDDEEFVLLME